LRVHIVSIVINVYIPIKLQSIFGMDAIGG
jgi:hypothetical protein